MMNPQARPVAAPSRFRVVVLSLFLVLFSLVEIGCSVQRSPVTGNKRAYGYTWEQELQIGREADQQIVAQYGVYEDQQLTNYVNRVAEKVLAESHFRAQLQEEKYRGTDFTFRVLDSPVINAFALPGGYVYITRGLLAYMENEAQLAVVLGHEIGHVAGRHASQRALSTQLAQGGLILGAIGGELAGIGGRNVLEAGSAGAQLLLMSYGRDDERESDQLGVDYAARSGYAAGEGAGFFTTLKRMAEKSGQSIPSFMSTHPDPGEREATILELADEYDDQYVMNTVNKDELYAQIDGIVFGDNPREGFVENSTFYHPDLRFRLPVPQGWVTQNTKTQFVMADNPQQTQAIAALTFESGVSSARQAAERFAQEASQQQGISIINDQATTVNGLSAYVVEAVAAAQNGGQTSALIYYIEYNGNVYRLMGLTARQNYAQYSRLFAQTFGGFNRLTDQRILSVQPNRLQIKRASGNTTLQAVVPRSLPQDLQPIDIAILNQMDLNSRVSSGEKIKVVTD